MSSIGRRGFLTGSAALAGASTLVQAVPAAASAAKFPFPTESDLRVLVVGDTGTGGRGQWAVADALRTFHRREPFALAVGLGDNIYESGPTSDFDSQFATKFENPYHGLDFPWVMVLGNHDNSSFLPGDGGWLERGNLEVEYHSRSQRWWMPRRYYSVRLPVAEFFVLDVNPIANYLPAVASPYWAPDGQYMAEQRAWLDQAIAASTATWKFVCTHQPFLNNGPHGDAGHYESLSIDPIDGRHAQRFFADNVAGKVPFLLSGHDHSMQVLEPAVATKGTRQIISGAAALTVHDEPPEPRATPKHAAAYENYVDLGFMVLDLTSSSVHLRAFTVDVASGTAAKVFDRRLA